MEDSLDIADWVRTGVMIFGSLTALVIAVAGFYRTEILAMLRGKKIRLRCGTEPPFFQSINGNETSFRGRISITNHSKQAFKSVTLYITEITVNKSLLPNFVPFRLIWHLEQLPSIDYLLPGQECFGDLFTLDSMSGAPRLNADDMQLTFPGNLSVEPQLLPILAGQPINIVFQILSSEHCHTRGEISIKTRQSLLDWLGDEKKEPGGFEVNVSHYPCGS